MPVAEVPLSELTPATLLKALVSVTVRAKSSLVARELARLRMFRELPMDLITAFLENPSRIVRSRDLRRVLRLSRRVARALVRSSQRTRGEHLFTALRSATCILLMSYGLNRAAIEGYLGITDRPTFRRACRRAGVPPPCHDVDLSAFSA